MDANTQERRLLRIQIALGQDHVLLVSMRGQDRLSTCFAYDLELASTDDPVKPGDLLATSATIWLNDGAGVTVPFNGILAADRRQRLSHFPGSDSPTNRRSAAR